MCEPLGNRRLPTPFYSVSSVIIFLAEVEKTQFFQHLIDSGNQILLVAPDDGVFDQVLLVLAVAALLQCADAIGPIVLQVGHLRFDGVRRTATA